MREENGSFGHVLIDLRPSSEGFDWVTVDFEGRGFWVGEVTMIEEK